MNRHIEKIYLNFSEEEKESEIKGISSFTKDRKIYFLIAKDEKEFIFFYEIPLTFPFVPPILKILSSKKKGKIITISSLQNEWMPCLSLLGIIHSIIPELKEEDSLKFNRRKAGLTFFNQTNEEV